MQCFFPLVNMAGMFRITDYVTPVGAAKIIGCTKGRIYQKLRDGDFKTAVTVGENRVLIGRRECEKIAKTPEKTGRPRSILVS